MKRIWLIKLKHGDVEVETETSSPLTYVILDEIVQSLRIQGLASSRLDIMDWEMKEPETKRTEDK